MASICQGETCQAVIDWATWPDGTHRHPITRPRPCPGPGEACTHEGNLAVWRDGSGRLRWRSLVEGEQLAGREHRGRSHYADCPDADAFRCPRCRHKRHPQGPCTRQGPITCQTVDLGDRGSARVRGRFPCGCTEGVAGDAGTSSPALNG
jgi:hypothetical protein